jgi:hypothetical protein
MCCGFCAKMLVSASLFHSHAGLARRTAIAIFANGPLIGNKNLRCI